MHAPRHRPTSFLAGALLLLAAACGGAAGTSVGVEFPPTDATAPDATAPDGDGYGDSDSDSDGDSDGDGDGDGDGDAPSVDPETPVSDGPAAGGGMAMCAPGVPDCTDMVVNPDGEVTCPPEGCGGDPAAPDQTYVEVAPRPIAGQAAPRPWDEAVPSADGTQVSVRWWSGVEPCTVLADVQVEETPERVVITVFEGPDQAPDAEPVACIDIAQAKQTTVQLAAPLADRPVVDGSTA